MHQQILPEHVSHKISRLPSENQRKMPLSWDAFCLGHVVHDMESQIAAEPIGQLEPCTHLPLVLPKCASFNSEGQLSEDWMTRIFRGGRWTRWFPGCFFPNVSKRSCPTQKAETGRSGTNVTSNLYPSCRMMGSACPRHCGSRRCSAHHPTGRIYIFNVRFVPDLHSVSGM